jgi:hypothetical protein
MSFGRGATCPGNRRRTLSFRSDPEAERREETPFKFLAECVLVSLNPPLAFVPQNRTCGLGRTGQN